jgi:hypothetical protein
MLAACSLPELKNLRGAAGKNLQHPAFFDYYKLINS